MLRLITKNKKTGSEYKRKIYIYIYMQYIMMKTTLWPRNLPIAANKWRMLLVFKLTKTSLAVRLPLFRASSDSNSAEGSKIFLDDWRRRRPLLLQREISTRTVSKVTDPESYAHINKFWNKRRWRNSLQASLRVQVVPEQPAWKPW